MMSFVGNILNLREAHGTSGQILQESTQACGPRFRRALGNLAEDPNVEVISQGRGEVTVGEGTE